MCVKNLFFNKNRHPTASPPPPQTEQKTHDEEPPPKVLEMDQLEAELQFELQKLICASCATDAPGYEEIRQDLAEPEVFLFLIFPYV